MYPFPSAFDTNRYLALLATGPEDGRVAATGEPSSRLYQQTRQPRRAVPRLFQDLCLRAYTPHWELSTWLLSGLHRKPRVAALFGWTRELLLGALSHTIRSPTPNTGVGTP